jgi:NAD(P)-dependent dehydrogenase (short-subunit alcohol dehydrogenase family)
MKRNRILITGATGAIGREIAGALAKDGACLFLHCLKSAEKMDSLKFLCEGAGARTRVKFSDISRADAAKGLVEDAANAMGGIDAIIHCASIFKRTPLGEVSEDIWDETIAANLKSSFFLAQTAGGLMRDNGGSIIMMSDLASTRPYAGYLPYCISKAGIDAMVKGMAKALAPKIIVNAIAPYVVTRHSEISDKGWNDILSKIPMHRPTDVSEIVRIVSFLLDSDCTMTGEIIKIDGGRSLL